MSQIAILSRDERLVELVGSSGLSVARIEPGGLLSDSTGSAAPSVLLVDMRGRAHLPVEVTEFNRLNPASSIALIVTALEPAIMLEGMRAGANECIPEPLTARLLDETVRRLLTSSAPPTSGKVLAFVGAKGGVGTTTLAVNVAAALQRGKSGRVLLIDLHVANGEAALFLGVEPRFSIVDALDNVHRVDESFFGSLVEKTKAGVHLLASPTRTLAGPVDGRRVRTTIEAAAQAYQTVVLDVARSDSTMLDSLDAASRIVIVSSQEIASIRNAAQMAETLRGRYGDSRVAVVVNRYDPKATIKKEDIERTVGRAVEDLIPSDYGTAVDALNAGLPIVSEDGRLASAIKTFAHSLAGVSKEAESGPVPGSVFGRLSWKRV